MAFYQVLLTFPGGSQKSDIALRKDNAKAAREYVQHRFSEAYGFAESQRPTSIRLRRISEATAEAIVDAGGIDWMH